MLKVKALVEREPRRASKRDATPPKEDPRPKGYTSNYPFPPSKE
jgi:hypothetical protein